MQDQLSQNATGAANQLLDALSEAIKGAVLKHRPGALADAEQIDQAARDQADAVMSVLDAMGYIVPGVPALAVVLRDFKVTHDRLTLTMLALRILNMLAFSEVVTPESKPARQFIDDYLQGKNHGPAGEPMLWPGRLPGLANLLREWGFVPTIALPGQASFVARAQPPVVVQ